MSKRSKRAGAGVLPALVMGLAVVAGCDLEVENPGALLDPDINDLVTLPFLVNGAAQEFNQLPDNLALDVLRLTDEAAGTGSYFQTGRMRRGAFDWTETGGMFGQLHETIWTGQSAWERMAHPDVVADGYDRDTSVDAARVWLLIGMTHRMFGENFCEVVYSTGADWNVPEPGPVVDRTAAFDSAIVAFDRAITIGTAAGSAAAAHVMAAHAGKAQAYLGKGDFTAAIAEAALVPTDFEMVAFYNSSVNSNIVRQETIGRNEVGLFNSYVFNIAGGSGSSSDQDPRVPFRICGTFDDPANLHDLVTGNTYFTPTGRCSSPQGADGVTAHYQQRKYTSNSSDIIVASGREMRLIEAEAALLASDLTTFTAKINEVRDYYDIGPIAEPATAGTLEYTNGLYDRHNAYDAKAGNVGDPGVDGWSILDGERHLTLWGEGRRLFDLHRWSHPFLDGGLVFWDAEPRRVSCYPVPEIECTLNPALKGSALRTGVADGTTTCG